MSSYKQKSNVFSHPDFGIVAVILIIFMHKSHCNKLYAVVSKMKPICLAPIKFHFGGK